MAKVKFTKGELKKQRDSLKQFRHYLPTLQLKKQQLQMKILEAKKGLAQLEANLEIKEAGIGEWSGLLADNPRIDLPTWILPLEILTEEHNIAGANIPIFQDIRFESSGYDLYETPLWVDKAIQELREYIILAVELDIIHRQIRILERELQITTQRVNLFEKVKIPECVDNIRRIRIYLGDQQANAVGIGKVAKKKVEDAKLLEVGA